MSDPDPIFVAIEHRHKEIIQILADVIMDTLTRPSNIRVSDKFESKLHDFLDENLSVNL